MKGIKYTIAIVISMSILAFGNSALAMMAPRYQIRPGWGLGDVKLGDTMDVVINKTRDVLGRAEKLRKEKKEKKYYLIFVSRRVTFVFHGTVAKKSELEKIVITSPGFLIEGNGAGVGDRYRSLFYNEKYLPPYLEGEDCKHKRQSMNQTAFQDRTHECKGINFIVNERNDVIEAIEVVR